MDHAEPGQHHNIVITKDGKPVAALVNAALFERIRAMQERFDALCDRIAKSYENVPEDEAMAEIEQACALARRPPMSGVVPDACRRSL